MKKVFVLLLAAFVIYYLITSPDGAADAVTSVVEAGGQILVFFEELTT